MSICNRTNRLRTLEVGVLTGEEEKGKLRVQKGRPPVLMQLWLLKYLHSISCIHKGPASNDTPIPLTPKSSIPRVTSWVRRVALWPWVQSRNWRRRRRRKQKQHFPLKREPGRLEQKANSTAREGRCHSAVAWDRKKVSMAKEKLVLWLGLTESRWVINNDVQAEE